MPYRYLDNIALADAAFEAWGKTTPELFAACARALLNVMVKDIKSVKYKHHTDINLREDDLETLLVQFLQVIIYNKDARHLLLLPAKKGIEIMEVHDRFTLKGRMQGETIDPQRHTLMVDVKAVTYHRLKIIQTPEAWHATVVLDV